MDEKYERKRLNYENRGKECQERLFLDSIFDIPINPFEEYGQRSGWFEVKIDENGAKEDEAREMGKGYEEKRKVKSMVFGGRVK